MSVTTEPTPVVNSVDAHTFRGTPPEPPERKSEPPESKDKAWREWMAIAVGLTALMSVLAIIISTAALSSGGATKTTVITTPAAAAAPASGSVATAAVAPQSITLAVKADSEHGRLGPDGQWHDAFLPADFSVRPGATVTVTVLNYDSGPHSFTAPSMHVNAVIPGGGSMGAPTHYTFTFKAPATAGKYAWWCAIPCDPFAMAHDGYMRGYVTVRA